MLKFVHKTGELAGLYDDGGIIVQARQQLLVLVIADALWWLIVVAVPIQMQRWRKRIGAVNQYQFDNNPGR